MKLKQHWDIGKLVYTELCGHSINAGNKVLLKIPFLIGNIAPDLNCVYPAHRLNTTEKRFYRRLKITTHTNLMIVKSFILGVITHYICDYFCYAHNNESLGVKHKAYETNLWRYYVSHKEEIVKTSNRLKDTWLKNKKESVQDIIGHSEINTKEQCDMILEQLIKMNKEYLNSTNVNRDKNWEKTETQLIYDMQYIVFMTRNIDKLIMEPFRCILLT